MRDPTRITIVTQDPVMIAQLLAIWAAQAGDIISFYDRPWLLESYESIVNREGIKIVEAVMVELIKIAPDLAPEPKALS